ncbi:MAG: RdgB/HAM1 family non-canonical purine NTP pyrophosphatase [Acidimicrobiaceae bacterium]|nr:RdgB/HAM1 family non-canonical purine NTP pyrophosphatase [Acidimicrobiaceae bacterium]
MTTFVLATANPHKTEEMRAVLGDLGIELLARPAHVAEVEENEVTLEGNALLKARALVMATGHAAIADDTGLFVDALGGRPGVFSARYAGPDATYDENVTKLLDEMSEVDDMDRTATFRTVVCVAYPSGESLCVQGTLPGRIGRERRGSNGFGYDPVFEPDDAEGRTLAQLTPDEKNADSHRSRALHALVDALRTSS